MCTLFMIFAHIITVIDISSIDSPAKLNNKSTQSIFNSKIVVPKYENPTPLKDRRACFRT